MDFLNLDFIKYVENVKKNFSVFLSQIILPTNPIELVEINERLFLGFLEEDLFYFFS